MSFKSYALLAAGWHSCPRRSATADLSPVHGPDRRFCAIRPRRAGNPGIMPGLSAPLAFSGHAHTRPRHLLEQSPKGRLSSSGCRACRAYPAHGLRWFQLSPVTRFRAAAPIAIRPPAADRVYMKARVEGGCSRRGACIGGVPTGPAESSPAGRGAKTWLPVADPGPASVELLHLNSAVEGFVPS